MKSLGYTGLLLCLCGLLLVRCTSSPDLAERYFTMPEALPDSIKTGDFLFKEGMAAYRAQEYLPAVSFFLQVDQTTVGFDTLSFYIGVCEMALDENERALGFLEAAEAMASPAMRPQLLWYLALAQIKVSRNVLARRTLEQLSKLEGPAFTSQADALLAELGD